METVEGKKFIDDAVKHAKAAKNELSKKVNETVKATVDKMGLITRKEIANLKKKYAILQKICAALRMFIRSKMQKRLH
ncbi:MAG: hypothetical protein LE168_03075 [Endomicrobium sp.]|nr:hypothetical protein [Endomicrobium sp.]